MSKLPQEKEAVLKGKPVDWWMTALKDEYVSAEHYLLALSDSGVSAGKLLKEVGVTRAKLMHALQQVRGSQR